MSREVEIYWGDLTPEARQRLKEAGFDDLNVIEGVFPLTVIPIEDDEEEIEF